MFPHKRMILRGLVLTLTPVIVDGRRYYAFVDPSIGQLILQPAEFRAQHGGRKQT